MNLAQLPLVRFHLPYTSHLRHHEAALGVSFLEIMGSLFCKFGLIYYLIGIPLTTARYILHLFLKSKYQFGGPCAVLTSESLL
jgi:hypothetical protein